MRTSRSILPLSVAVALTLPAMASAAVSGPTRAAIRALHTSADQVRHGRPYDLERDRRRGRPVWEVKVAAGDRRPYEFDVSADGRHVVHASRHARDDDVSKALRAKVSLTRALRVADRRAAGRLSSAEIDRRRSAIVWTASFDASGGREREVVVDARTGRVVAIETEHDDD